MKKEIKKKIAEDIEKTVLEKKKEMKKLRFIKGTDKTLYLKKMKTNEAVLIMRTRLNMLDLKANFRGKYETDICGLCNEKEDTTEHLFTCKELVSEKGEDITELVEFLKRAEAKKGSVHPGSADGLGHEHTILLK